MKTSACTRLAVFALVLFLAACDSPPETEQHLLVFTKTTSSQPGSTDAGIAALQTIGETHGYHVDVTDAAEAFTEVNLQRYGAVVFLNTTGDVLNYYQQNDFERFIQAGGGFVGIHSAAATEYDWPWYGKLVGAYYDREALQPRSVQRGVVRLASDQGPSTEGLAVEWELTDQVPTYTPFASEVDVLLTTADDQPLAWYHEYDGGRAFYTGGGGTPQSFDDPNFLAHLESGVQYALGSGTLNYGTTRTDRMPEESRFKKVALVDNLNEPTELVLLGDGHVLFAERKGALKYYDPEADSIEVVTTLEVNLTHEDGLIGLALDPNYDENNWIYLYYSPPEDTVNRLSRFVFDPETRELDMDSEIMMLEVETQRVECCHTGGSIEFDANGNLFLSTGDNTNPFHSDGYAPIDGRPGRAPFDGLDGPGDTSDLRGKILRITPQPDGSYTIPEGNLFEDDDPRTRPEIYVMGNRNPYRISIDPKTGYLYWGEVGPDARENHPQRGPRGHDEVNQAREAGNFGWPMFVGDNKPYGDYDFATEEHGPLFDPEAPINDSPNNTGLRELPPAQSAFIWYPYAESPEFPIVGVGGRNAMAGPVFYSDLFEDSEYGFPDYFDGKLFIYDWIRGWILVASMNEEGDLLDLEPFMPNTDFSNPIDMAFDEGGVMYLLEYGRGWFEQNPDARLVRIEYHGGNRAPVARIEASETVGGAPLTVHLSAETSTDEDGESLTYLWTKGDGTAETFEGSEAEFTYAFTGTFRPSVVVTDEHGNTDEAELEVRVGNEPPYIAFDFEGNSTFYWDNAELQYSVEVSDPEDGTLRYGGVDPSEVKVYFDYLAEGFDQTLIAQGHQTAEAVAAAENQGARLMAASDCKACHLENRPSIGPSYLDVARRYQDDEEAPAYLANKIINGGGGVWGEQAMSAHPQFTVEEATTIVNYILALAAEDAGPASRPLSGTFAPRDHIDSEAEGTYFLKATYTDQGAAGVNPLTVQDVHILRHPRIQAEAFSRAHSVGQETEETGPTWVTDLFDGSYLVFENIDLTDVQALSFRVHAEEGQHAGGRIEVHLDRLGGRLLSSIEVPAQEGEDATDELRTAFRSVDRVHDVYVVFKNDDANGNVLFDLDWIYFDNRAVAL